jgi:hypothetical protein
VKARWLLLLLRDYHAARERRHLYLAALAEQRRQMAVKHLAMCDAPKPARPLRCRRLLHLFWDGL